MGLKVKWYWYEYKVKLSGISEWNEWCSKGKSRNCRLNVLGADGVLHANSQDRIMNLVQLV